MLPFVALPRLYASFPNFALYYVSPRKPSKPASLQSSSQYVCSFTLHIHLSAGQFEHEVRVAFSSLHILMHKPKEQTLHFCSWDLLGVFWLYVTFLNRVNYFRGRFHFVDLTSCPFLIKEKYEVSKYFFFFFLKEHQMVLVQLNRAQTSFKTVTLFAVLCINHWIQIY